MAKIRRQRCSACRGWGVTYGASTPCRACAGSGVRFVPEGYTQAQLEIVRNLVDAMAIRQGIA